LLLRDPSLLVLLRNRMFVDRVRIYASAGRGGRGCVSFLREPHRPWGGPDGGDGGAGGSVVLEVDPNLYGLGHLRSFPHQRAGKGSPGGPGGRTGRKGKDRLIKVPPGTVVYRIPDAQGRNLLPVPPARQPLNMVVDLVEPGQRWVLCRGGKGGRGNRHFRSPTNRTPREYEEGHPGESGQFVLELKSIADVGLVGYPNAGKSSLLRALSPAKPKVAPYPFTTLSPVVGVLEWEDGFRCTMADIPGLVEGAHRGKGLGQEFLRHVERASVLLYVIDVSGAEGRKPWEDFLHLREELGLYDPVLLERPFLVVANKMDILPSRTLLRMLEKKSQPHPVIPVSALQGAGLALLRAKLRELLESRSGAARPGGTSPSQRESDTSLNVVQAEAVAGHGPAHQP
jgi:GTP-binding protein